MDSGVAPEPSGPDELDAGLQPSFDSLPLELRLKCLANCDWQTLSRVACVSRGTRGLVSYLVRTPYWHTLAEEQPAVLCTDFATDEEREAACNNWARQLTARLCGRGKPDICFVFVSSKSHANLPTMLRALRSHLAQCTALVGAVSAGVLGRDSDTTAIREVESAERVGLVVSVVHLPPGTELHAAFAREGLSLPDWQQQDLDERGSPLGNGLFPEDRGSVDGGSSAGGASSEGPLVEGELPEGPAEHRRIWLMVSDRHAHVDGVLKELGQRYPGETVCGGMGGGTDGCSSLLVGLPGRGPDDPLHADVTSGTLLLSISGPNVEVELLAARGMRCISQCFMVSQVSPNVDLSPVGRVTLVQQLQNGVALATRTDRLTWVPVGASFTPTSALVAALQAQGGQVAPRAPLFFGVRTPGRTREESDPKRMVMLQMHDPNNLMRTSGYVSVQHPVQQGMISAFFTPQPQLSRVQMRAQLQEGARAIARGDSRLMEEPVPLTSPTMPVESIHKVLNVAPSPVYGCLMFPCVAKGRRYYEEANVEAAMVAEAMPQAALAGFFCNGEIGPAPPDELSPSDGQSARMMGYSTVACLLKLTPAPPPPADWAR